MEMFMWKEPNRYHDHFVCGYDGKVPNRDHNPKTMMSCASSSPIALDYIQHPISKLDTLAGIAIKYGVEVADIKKMNGLVTDRQMFALKTLHIPLPGSPPDRASCELSEPFRSLGMKSSEQKLSLAVNFSQGYNGTVPTVKKSICEVLEMAVCSKGSSNSLENDPFCMKSTMSDQPPRHHKKSRSLAERILDEIMERSDIVPVAEAMEGDSDKWNDTLAQKLEADLNVTPELLLRQDNSNSCGLSSRTGKGLAQRQRAASRIALNMEDAFLIERLSSVRKSSSTSCLQGQGNNSFSSIQSTSRRNLNTDLMAFSTAGTAKPISTGRRNKAALD